MTFQRAFLVFLIGLLLEGAGFAGAYRDLLYLRQPTAVILAGPTGLFHQAALKALGRTHLTATQLQRIAEAAQGFRLAQPEIAARTRLYTEHSRDLRAALGLADALRRDGQFAAAEQIYRRVLDGQP
jgi:hypothetical protein